METVRSFVTICELARDSRIVSSTTRDNGTVRSPRLGVAVDMPHIAFACLQNLVKGIILVTPTVVTIINYFWRIWEFSGVFISKNTNTPN